MSVLDDWINVLHNILHKVYTC